MDQGHSQGRVPGVPEPLLSKFLTVILSQEECNGLDSRNSSFCSTLTISTVNIIVVSIYVSLAFSET